MRAQSENDQQSGNDIAQTATGSTLCPNMSTWGRLAYARNQIPPLLAQPSRQLGAGVHRTSQIPPLPAKTPAEARTPLCSLKQRQGLARRDIGRQSEMHPWPHKPKTLGQPFHHPSVHEAVRSIVAMGQYECAHGRLVDGLPCRWGVDARSKVALMSPLSH